MAAITAGQCFRFKLLHILEVAGQEVLTYTLLCGTPGKAPTDTLVQYLNSLPQSSSSNFIKEKKKTNKCFNSTDMVQINGDPSCLSFDITLLHKAIKVACENVAGTNDMVNNVNKWSSATLVQGCDLEHFATKIKDTRNDVVHERHPLTEAQFLNEVTRLSDIFKRSLRATKNRYLRDNGEYQTKKDAVLAVVTDIRKENLGEDEILQRSARNMLPLYKTEINVELKARLDSAKYLDPLYFLSGIQDQKIEVNNIFCDIVLAEEKKTAHKGEISEVPYLEVLHLCDSAMSSSAGVGPSGQARPHVLVVEGEAGSGKTTFATFLLSQWLIPQSVRRVQGLQRYDLMLWVVCRDQSSRSLQDFMEVLLPDSYIRYGHLLLPLLKQCRVLVLIDGLDEINAVSEQLVADILGEAAATTFTIVCTARPESVQDMKTQARTNYQVSHVKMMGITQTERTELVVRHYAWLCDDPNTTASTDALRRVMQNIGSRELFRLPLNLLFLATFFFCEPDKVSTTITQSELFQFIHMWCVQKLQVRLGAPFQAGNARVLRQNAVARVLPVMYGVALKGLMQGRVYLNPQDLKDIQNVCSKEDLNAKEVLPAFLCLRREVSLGVVTESYLFPHKGLQDFMAAKYIAEEVSQYREGAIERALQTFAVGQDPRFDQLRNMLIHLLGLLTRQTPTVLEAMKESVGLLRRSGVRKTDEWLFLLADTAAPDGVIQHVVGGLNAFPENEIIYVMDGIVTAASMMLPHLPPRKVRVHLTREPAGADRLARALAHHTVRHLILVHHFKHLHQHAASATLLRSIPRNDLWIFIGHLDHDHLQLLPQGLQELFLVVDGSDHARSLLPALSKVLRSLSNLQSLSLHIPVTVVDPRAVTRLPANTPRLSLVLSGVADQRVAEAAGKIVAALSPPKRGLSMLEFPGATLGLKGWEVLFKKLQQDGVRVRSFVGVPDSDISENEVKQLSTLATTALGCQVLRRTDGAMWP